MVIRWQGKGQADSVGVTQSLRAAAGAAAAAAAGAEALAWTRGGSEGSFHLNFTRLVPCAVCFHHARSGEVLQTAAGVHLPLELLDFVWRSLNYHKR